MCVPGFFYGFFTLLLWISQFLTDVIIVYMWLLVPLKDCKLPRKRVLSNQTCVTEWGKLSKSLSHTWPARCLCRSWRRTWVGQRINATEGGQTYYSPHRHCFLSFSGIFPLLFSKCEIGESIVFDLWLECRPPHSMPSQPLKITLSR